MGASKGTYEIVLNLLGEIKNKRVLDCGAGKGSFTELLIKKKAKTYACDIDHNRFKLKVPFRKSDLNNKINFENSYFDKVVSIEVIEHLENFVKFIQELNRILRKHGELIITTPNIQNIKSKIQFLFKSEFHWFQEKEFGKNGSRHLHPIYWREIVFFLDKYGFKIEEITTNRRFGYTLYSTKEDKIIKSISCAIANVFFDIFYRILSIFTFPKNNTLLFGDILIIKAIKK